MGKSPATATVFVDADNTLWDTNRVYAKAQLALLSDVERAIGHAAPGSDRLAYLRDVDQALAARHHAGLRYPPALLVHALAFRLTGEPADASIRRALKDNGPHALEAQLASAIGEEFLKRLKAIPPLRPGVAEGLSRLHGFGAILIVVTEGARDRVARTAEHFGLMTWIDRIVEAPKQADLYRRIGRLSDAPPPRFMVGDQLQRDIAPAQAAGLETIYFPGDFRPGWEPEENEVRPDHRIDTFGAVLSIVAAKLKGEQGKGLA